MTSAPGRSAAPNHSATLSRRAALSLAGVGSAVFLSSCSTTLVSSTANTLETPTATASDTTPTAPAERTDFAGEVKLEKYDTTAGRFVPATYEHPAQNVPKPIKPDDANTDSVAGLYSAIAFIVAAHGYVNQTGDLQYLEQSALSTADKETTSRNPAYLKMRNAQLWFAEPATTVYLQTPQPEQDSRGYTWAFTQHVSNGDFYVENGQVVQVPADQKNQGYAGVIIAQYSDSTWVVRFDYQDQ